MLLEQPFTVTAEVPVAFGWRVMVLGNLLLTKDPQAEESSLSALIGQAMDGWEGPGVVVLAGNLFDLTSCQHPSEPDELQVWAKGDDLEKARCQPQVEKIEHGNGHGSTGTFAEDLTTASVAQDITQQILASHPRLLKALKSFLGSPNRQVVYLPGDRDSQVWTNEASLRRIEALGVTMARSVELLIETGHGLERVLVKPGGPTDGPFGAPRPIPANLWLSGLRPPDPRRPTPTRRSWLDGMDRLADTAALPRFVSSRLAYRKMGRYAWLLGLPIAVALLMRIPFLFYLLTKTVPKRLGAHRVLEAMSPVSWHPIILAVAGTTIVEALVLAGVLALIGRLAWAALGELVNPGGAVASDPNQLARQEATALVESGYAGMVTSHTFQPELSHLAGGFYANTGASAEIVEERGAWLGLPSVFLPCRQLSWLEIEAGGELHVRLLLAKEEPDPGTLLERLARRHRRVHQSVPSTVASWPRGSIWPPPETRGPRRLVQRLAAAAIAITGIIDLLSAVTPPLRGRLHAVLEVLPLPATQAAAALVAVAGLALLGLARGIRLGQRRTWLIAMAVLALSVLLNVAKGGDFEESTVSLALMAFLFATRGYFNARSDPRSLHSAARALALAAVAITIAVSAVVELVLWIISPHRLLPYTQALLAVVTRMAGFQEVTLPNRLNQFLSPSLLSVGLVLIAVAVFLATRPVREHRRAHPHDALARARTIVARHGGGTLDYFALRDDKQYFFYRESLVAYAVFNGVCLLAPDPIGPKGEREQIWSEFRRFTDSQGWSVGVIGAGEEWLAIYRASGMHHFYMGDEAVVDVTSFTLEGNRNKGLRQAHRRIAKYGYTISFYDPSLIDDQLAGELRRVMRGSRRGNAERGFSMMLGRAFNPEDKGLLLAVAKDSSGRAVAFCQYVPASKIGGFSLDLMRHDGGEHPNGLLDFVLVETIMYLREKGFTGLALNFAAMRAVLDGTVGDSIARRLERWLFKRLSDSIQIESLWKFNAKYHPSWLPRFVVYDSLERIVPTALALLRAESIWELPIFGRFLVPSQGGDETSERLALSIEAAGHSTD
ncbi:MAG: phosphatidylglycerol lysyltransferase domain-containing protein [Actinobacteria bacterium]|nr:phosphatidylglycerol lysyltransferase domain-containing protein [Actinomycetota bacterium]